MSNQDLKIGFIGGGNMAQAIVGGLIAAGHTPDCICVSDPASDQRDRLRTLHHDIRVTNDNDAAIDAAEIVVLAVKPQIMAKVLNALTTTSIAADCLFISIAAGIQLESLRNMLLPNEAIVRVMPNQPALVGAGMSVLSGTEQISTEQKSRALYVSEATGAAEWVNDEWLMDAVTAVSGSGPAYFYYFMEVIEECARALGLPGSLARTLTRQTALGAGLAASQSELDLNQLRTSVTSKGGTTAAALAVFEHPEFRAIVVRALTAARDRSIQLGAPDLAANRSHDDDS